MIAIPQVSLLNLSFGVCIVLVLVNTHLSFYMYHNQSLWEQLFLENQSYQSFYILFISNNIVGMNNHFLSLKFYFVSLPGFTVNIFLIKFT